MESYLLDWANLLLRWVHVITAIAWIGSSFYFVFLDNNLLKPTAPDLLNKGVDGAMWAVHGGGFYHPQKYLVAPANIDSKLHWFYWESYSTWLSGFLLFTVLYLYNASTFLIDKSLIDWSPGAAISVALAFLVVFWIVYDLVCQAFGFRKNGEAIVAGCMLVVVAFASWLACQWFPGRAAFLLVGAMIATAMSANVLFWIIPGQRKVVAAMTSGQPFDAAALAIHGQRGKQRSVHNTYFTLPVLFAMLSNHYSFLYSHAYNWVLLFLMMLAGALIRQYFVLRHGYKHGRNANPLPWALGGMVLIVAVILALRPAPQSAAQETPAPSQANYAQVSAILAQRCVVCHGAQVQQKGLRLDMAKEVQARAKDIYQQTVLTRQMPLNNATTMSDAERATLAAWFQAGAKIE